MLSQWNVRFVEMYRETNLYQMSLIDLKRANHEPWSLETPVYIFL